MANPILPRPTDELPRYGGHGSRPEETGIGTALERFSHLVVGVTDLDVSEAWYRDVVGLELVGRNLTAEPSPHSVLRTNTGQMVILVVSKNFQRPPRNSRHQAFLMTPNAYIRAYERLTTMGLTVADTHEGHRALGNYSIDLLDPDGHRYQLQTYGPECHEYQPSTAGVVDCGPAERYKPGEVKAFKDGNFYLVRLREGF
ncbi:MAG TPA: VOC family protein, partial [Chloroflexota bacterium]|nr:VOC family protein [Chloroflexota bacterium]